MFFDLSQNEEKVALFSKPKGIDSPVRRKWSRGANAGSDLGDQMARMVRPRSAGLRRRHCKSRIVTMD